MSSDHPFIRAWGICIDCGYEGLLEYFSVAGESYDDLEAMGVMMLLHCPACDSDEHSLITMEYYRELLRSKQEDSQE